MKFYLVRPQDSTSSIYIDINYKSIRLRISTGIVVKSIAWNKSKEVVSRKNDNYTVINNNLKLIRSSIDNFINNLKINRKELSKKEFTDQVLEIMNPDRPKTVDEPENDDNEIQEKELSLLEEFDKWIEARKSSDKFSESTIKKYRGCYNRLIEFKRKMRSTISYQNMNLKFYNKYTKYLNKTGLVNNSVGVHIKIIKTFLREMEKLGRAVNIEYREFKAYKDPEPPTYALTDNEIELIEALEISSKKLEKTRDLFIAQLHTLVRVSDLMKIKKEHIDIDSMKIKIFVKKTKRPNILPITQKLLSVLEKYEYDLPKISEQKYNEYLKELAKLAGIDKPVEIVRPMGAGSQVQVLAKYEVMSSNMVRRSGITGLLRKKVQSKMIMQISGHKKLAVFERYIRMEQQDSLDAVRNAWDEG